jgi:hypothetical protein
MTPLAQASALKPFEIEIRRTGVGFATVRVEAADLQAAREMALEQAGDLEYSEKVSEYDLPGGDPEIQHARAQPGGQMKLYAVMKAVDGGPTEVSGIELRIDADFITRSRSLAALCQNMAVEQMNYFAESSRWLVSDPEHLPSAPLIVVTKSGLQVQGQDWSAGASICSAEVPIQAICEAFERGDECIYTSKKGVVSRQQFLCAAGGEALDLESAGTETTATAPRER